MHERHALLRQVLEMSNDAFCLIDAGGNLQFVNHKGKELFGPLEFGSPFAAIEQELSRDPGNSPDLFSLLMAALLSARLAMIPDLRRYKVWPFTASGM
jgi:PAS domain-containing protein